MKRNVVKSQSLLQRIIALKLPREIWETFSRKKKKKTRSCLLTWNTTRSTQQTVKDGRSWSLRLALFSELAIATRHAKSTTPTWTLEFVGFENQSAKQSTSVAPEQLEIGKVNSVHFLRADDWNDVDRDPSKSSVTLLSSQQAQHSRFISSAFRSWKEAQHTMIVS